MIRAYRLFTGPDGASHVEAGSVALDARTPVVTAYVEESPPHSSLDWHDAPQTQYVVTLRGTLEFATRDGETFVLEPGDVLVATDTSGTGHRWRLTDDQPWQRMYVVLAPGAPELFVRNGQG